MNARTQPSRWVIDMTNEEVYFIRDVEQGLTIPGTYTKDKSLVSEICKAHNDAVLKIIDTDVWKALLTCDEKMQELKQFVGAWRRPEELRAKGSDRG